MKKFLLLFLSIIGLNASASDFKVGVIYSPSAEKSGDYDRCTGTLLAPNIVLTALHCLMDYSGNMKELSEIHFALGVKTLDEALQTANQTIVKNKINFKGFESRLNSFKNGLGPQLFDEPTLLILNESFVLSKNNLSLGIHRSESSLSPLFYSFDYHGKEGLASYIAQNFTTKKEIFSEKKTYSSFNMTNADLNGASGSPLIVGNKIVGIVTTILGHEQGFEGILFDEKMISLLNEAIKEESSSSMTAYNR